MVSKILQRERKEGICVLSEEDEEAERLLSCHISAEG